MEQIQQPASNVQRSTFNDQCSTSNVQRSQRLQSLDVLRGMTVAGMILVNNGFGESFETLRHSKWNGMTPCDLVFPFFLFIMGVSCYLSLSKSKFTASTPVLFKILKRTVLLFAIGLFINWFDHAVEGDLLCFGHLRIWAVMQRIALCYFFVSMFALYCNHRYILHTVVGLLVVYTFILLLGNGYAEDASVNILAQADLQLFGYDHLYHKSPVDPEGLVGTISSVAHVLLGFYCGRLLKLGNDGENERMRNGENEKMRNGENEKMRNGEGRSSLVMVFALGATCVIAGYLLSFGLPLNKRIWSPSYVFMTCGLASLLLGLLINVENERMRNGENERMRYFTLHSSFFKVFGVNALALYVGSELLAILFSRFSISPFIYNALHAVIPADKWASLAYALTFVAINYLLGYILWKRKIFIKL